ncbi:MAG: hypothetical protein AAF678_06025 [Pseudomonadota bacterium]
MKIMNAIVFIGGLALLVYAGVSYHKVTSQLQEVVADMVDGQTVGAASEDTKSEGADAHAEVKLPKIFSSRGRELTRDHVEGMLSGAPNRKSTIFSFTEYFDLRDHMNPDEEMPRGDLRDLMAEVRATGPARDRCIDLERVFSGGCLFANHKTKRANTAHTIFELSATFYVAFADGIGTVPEGDAFSLIDEDFRMSFPFNPGNPKDILKPDFETAMRRALVAIEQACETVRSSTGNCFVSTASLAPKHSRSADAPVLFLRASLQYLLPIELAELQ